MQQKILQQTHVALIGDVHGCYDDLVRLLDRLGYEMIDGVYQHPQRLAVFVGDLIDRGPKIREVLELVHSMCINHKAISVLGNHEYNAVRFRSEINDYLAGNNDHKLPERIQRLMVKTLEQFSDYAEEWQLYTDWVTSVSLLREGEGFRVVHACWDALMIDEYQKQYSPERLSSDFLSAAKTIGSFESRVVDRLTRGTSMPLPQGVNIESKDGFIRHFFRTKFWAKSPKTYGDVIFQPDPLPYDLHEQAINNAEQDNLVDYPANAVPVFFGHYWLKGRPAPLLDNVACLDYSAVKFGRLVAYRFDGELKLLPENFIWVYLEPDH